MVTETDRIQSFCHLLMPIHSDFLDDLLVIFNKLLFNLWKSKQFILYNRTVLVQPPMGPRCAKKLTVKN